MRRTLLILTLVSCVLSGCATSPSLTQRSTSLSAEMARFNEAVAAFNADLETWKRDQSVLASNAHYPWLEALIAEADSKAIVEFPADSQRRQRDERMNSIVRATPMTEEQAAVLRAHIVMGAKYTTLKTRKDALLEWSRRINAERQAVMTGMEAQRHQNQEMLGALMLMQGLQGLEPTRPKAGVTCNTTGSGRTATTTCW